MCSDSGERQLIVSLLWIPLIFFIRSTVLWPWWFFPLNLTNLIPPKLIQPKQRVQPLTCSSFDELGIRLRITLCTFKVLESPVIPQCFITASFTGFVLHRVHWVVTIRWVLYCCTLKGWINASHPSAVSLCSYFSYLSFACLLFR